MKEIPFSTVLAALEDAGRVLPSQYIARFSDLSPAHLEAVLQIWPRLPLARQHLLLKRLVEAFEGDTVLSFETLAARLLDDPDGHVRGYALQLLAETYDARLIPRLVQLLSEDPEPTSRAEAAKLLGYFVEMGELEEISAARLAQATDSLLQALADPDGQVARTALEALGYSSREAVRPLIESACEHRDPRWRAAALVAAGRSADSAWQERVLEGLLSEHPAVRLAAVRAAGELKLKPARQPLLEMAEEEEEDDVLQAILWSLSLIGGEDVRTYLQTLMNDIEDDDLLDFLEDVFMNLDFAEDAGDFSLLAFDEDDPPIRKPKNGKKA